MAKFLNTTGVSYHLEELIKNTTDRLILISPYLQFSKRVKDHLEDLNLKKKDIRIIYRENKLQVEESNWLEGQIGIRTSLCSTLHAKCYINEHEAIVTSMNLYQFSQQNNDEMGVYVKKDEDPQLYRDIFEEAQRLLTISEEIRVSVKKVDKEADSKIEDSLNEIKKKKRNPNARLLSTKDLSQLLKTSSRNINSMLVDNKFMYKDGEDWVTTKRGKDFGGVERAGQYGKFVLWPEDIAETLKG